MFYFILALLVFSLFIAERIYSEIKIKKIRRLSRDGSYGHQKVPSDSWKSKNLSDQTFSGDDIRASNLVQGIVFFAACFVGIFALEAFIFYVLGAIFSRRIVPIGVGWVMLPILGGLAGWHVGSTSGVGGVARFLHLTVSSLGRAARFWMAGTVFWIILSSFVIFVFSPFGSYWGDDEWFKVAFTLLGPPGFCLLGFLFFKWADSGNR